MTVSLFINGREIKVRPGQKLLWAALDNGIYIPNLCALRDKTEPEAGCRLCWVEIEGRQEPVTACTEEVTEGMVVNTRGDKALQLARTGFELLMAAHTVDCARCPANQSCELQEIARYLGCKLKGKRFRKLVHDYPLDDSNPRFTYDPNKCVLCGRCVWACRKQGTGVIGFAHRGFDRIMTTFSHEPIGEKRCLNCGACVSVCPTGALSPKPNR
jgi:formate dehydrogenase major subunit/NADH-quinone oxidoreductase subunit G